MIDPSSFLQAVKVILDLFSENPGMYDHVAVVSFYPHILYKVRIAQHTQEYPIQNIILLLLEGYKHFPPIMNVFSMPFKYAVPIVTLAAF